MIRIEDLGSVQELCAVFEDSVCYTVMQGIGGSAWIDTVEMSEAVALVYGDFCFLAGSPVNVKNEKELLDMLEACNKKWSIFVPESKMWRDFLENKTSFGEYTRYRLKKRTEPFDKNLLTEYVEALSEEFHIEKIDAQWYKKVLTEEWSRDLCRQIETIEEYTEHGLGYLIVDGDRAVAGVSSYSYYDKGLEIEIGTREEYRRRGFATVLGAKFILACMEKGLYPNWDAANKVSVRTAEKLGYEFEKEYKVYSNVELKGMTDESINSACKQS